MLAGFAGTLLWRAALVGSTHAIELWAQFGTHLWWRLLVAPFTYVNTGYAIVTLGAIAIYGWLIERRHGPPGRAGPVRRRLGRRRRGDRRGCLTLPLALGGNGGALALLIAWVIPDLLSLRAGEEIEGDLLGTAVIAVVVALMPLAAPGASWVSAAIGALAGVLIGLPLALAGDR